MRLDKLLAERGAGSRKDVDRLIRSGAVELDGETVAKSGAKLKVPWSSTPIVDGFDYPPPPLVAAYYKPLGTVSSMKDEYGRPDLAAVLPQSWQKLLHPVGRLDADTSGLLLFSRDGTLTHRLLHPKYGVEREYAAEVENPVDAEALAAQLRAGVETTEDGEPFVVHGELLSVEGQTLRVAVQEGRYRMVRRMLANAGHPVVALHRVRYGSVRLDDLDLREDEAVALDDAALAWIRELQPRAGPKTAGASKGPRRPKPAADAVQRPRDAEEAMRLAWRPREWAVQLVMEEAGVSRLAAVEALARHEGDIVKALGDL